MSLSRSHPNYAGHEGLVAPVRPYPELWRLMVGLGIIVAVVLALNLTLFALVTAFGSADLVANFENGSSPESLLIILCSFVFATLGVTLAARQVQHRSLASIIGPTFAALAQFWRVLRALIILGVVVFVLPPYDMGAPLEPNLPLTRWFLLLPVALVAVLVQTSAEEILFRGYLQQSLAARFRAPWIWMGVPSLVFAFGHYAPVAAGENAILIAGWAFVFGVLSADLTARAGTLGPAIALHFFNNVTAMLIISLPDSLGGLALFHVPYDASDAGNLRQWLAVDFVVMFVSWLTARLALRR